jgi:phosphoribosylaminoimidazole-succinocarboxamide synthase
MKKLNKIHEGKAKILYATKDDDKIIQYFKDDTTAFNDPSKTKITQKKGVLNNFICEFIMNELTKSGIKNHFIERLDDREQLVRKLTIIPLEVIMRNISAGTTAKRLGLEEGIVFDEAVFEICYKEDALGDPIINDDHAIKILKAVTKEQLEEIKKISYKINDILKEIFSKINIKLVDFKIEFGFDNEQNIILADEISPDSCRLWDKDTNEKLDKDRFRRNLGGVKQAYEEIANRFNIKIN